VGVNNKHFSVPP